jgi:large subunit ribosomal protein L25
MKTVSMSGSRREGVGKKDAKKHRREGRVPCVLYGGKEEVHFAVEEKHLIKLLFTPETFFIKLNVDGSEYDCILKDVQYHPVSDHVLHADFLEFTMNKPITVPVPIKLTGNAPGVIQGGRLITKHRKLTATGLPVDMPDHIEIDISNLEVNDKVLVGDIKLKDITLRENPEQFIVKVSTTRMAASMVIEEEEEAEEGAEEGAEGEAAEGEAAGEGGGGEEKPTD